MRTLSALFLLAVTLAAQPVIRVNQVGFRPADTKSAVVLSDRDLGYVFLEVCDLTDGRMLRHEALTPRPAGPGRCAFAYVAEFTALRDTGEFELRCADAAPVRIRVGAAVYRPYLTFPLFYLLEQHCGDNAVLGRKCHQSDGIAVDGPDSGSHVDAVGGYHDASDYLRFLITTSYASGILLMTYKDHPGLWSDTLDARGRPGPNGVPDILDEARWGMEWMLKLTPRPGVLYHQVADDRDHTYWDLPYADSSDYGWGKGGARPVYNATGSSQGLFAFRNTSTGLANVAGRTAAVFALGSWIWTRHHLDTAFAARLAAKAVELYELGLAHPGCSESVPCRAPYRYNESSWTDDMEWGAAELFRLTGKERYRDEGMVYARTASDSGWMGRDTAKHYECFPYVNLGHAELWEFVGPKERLVLEGYYRAGLERVRIRGGANSFGIGVPFIWCSNNLAVGLVTQALLYRRMTGSDEFAGVLASTRDWLLGRNPWGQSFAIGVPFNGDFPLDPHSVVAKELGLRLTGALVDGPVYGSIYRSLAGLRLRREDRFAPYQSDAAVYHDDLGDYSTNEPTIDGTAGLLYILAAFSE